MRRGPPNGLSLPQPIWLNCRCGRRIRRSAQAGGGGKKLLPCCMSNDQISWKVSGPAPVNRTSLKPMTWSRPADMLGEIDLQWLLKVMPPAEATLCRALIRLLASPSPESANRGGRQIEMALLAELTGFSKRWVIELLQRLGKKNFIRTEGGSGAVKWIWLLPLGIPRLGGPFPPELTKKAATRRGKAKAPRAAASIPKRRRQEMAQSSKPGAESNVAPPVEKPAAIPEPRRKGPIPPAEAAASDDPVVLATALIPPPPAPHNPMLPAAMMPPPSSTPPGGPAPDNPVVAATSMTPAPSKARGGPAARNTRR